jgi:hypothetical protein
MKRRRTSRKESVSSGSLSDAHGIELTHAKQRAHYKSEWENAETGRYISTSITPALQGFTSTSSVAVCDGEGQPPDTEWIGQAIRASHALPSTGCHYFEVQFDRAGMRKGEFLGGGNFVGLVSSHVPAVAFSERNGVLKSNACWGLSDDSQVWKGEEGDKSITDLECANAFGLMFGAAESVGLLVDMTKQVVRFFRDSKPLRGLEITFSGGTDSPQLYYPVASIRLSGTSASLSCPQRRCKWEWGKDECGCC